MALWVLQLYIFCLSCTPSARASSNAQSQITNIHPFIVDLSAGVPRMRELVQNTRLPKDPEYPYLASSAGIDLDVLKFLRAEWLSKFDWQKEQDEMNRLKHFTSSIEGLTLHFIHERSSDPDAIPLLLNHGWPGSFLEFTPIIKELTQSAKTSTGKRVSFHIVVPSLPGFAFSSAPPANWTLEDTARVQHTLMTEILGYERFATHGTDYGSGPAYTLYANYSQSTRAAHFTFVPFLPLLPEQLAESNITLNGSLEKAEQSNALVWRTTGSAYFSEQATKPNTVGLALYDNPVGQLAWMGEKFISWSDPRQGTGPSLLTHNEILRSVSLFYLTNSFLSSVFTYFQNPTTFTTVYTKAKTDAPMLFSAFQYNVGFWPPALLEKIGNLVFYRNHEFGGHFAGVDNPMALIDDLREIANYWNNTY
ncbi:alpha/beta-hydrolase [Periconia macrospinosa]|uniref:Alpha/beta-hydrolase n=1 Tax=Periconia macrospinosa TaxID=97972 RepID=A0A2V1D7B4_9PLEO|nr:alpha/beta-hydrolase [Periconia macrospinosa]